MAVKVSADLEPTDKLLRRWASGERPRPKLHPLEAMQLMHDGAVLGGGTGAPDDDLVLVDGVYLKAPPRIKLVADVWYRRSRADTPVDVIANRLRVGRTKLYSEWRETLIHFRAQLTARGLDL